MLARDLHHLGIKHRYHGARFPDRPRLLIRFRDDGGYTLVTAIRSFISQR